MKKLLFTITLILASVYLLGQSWDHTYTYLPADSILAKDSIQILVLAADPADDTTFTMLVSDLDALWEGELNNEAGLYSALSDVTQFVEAGDSPTLLDGTANTVLYIDGSGDVTEVALGSSGTYLESQGDGSAPTWSTPSGSGDVSKVGTPANNQVGIWTGDGTLEGDVDLTFDGDNLTVDGTVTGTGFTIGSAAITEAELEVIDGATLTTTELNYVDGVTSAIQTQLDAKLNEADTLAANTQVWMLTDTIPTTSFQIDTSLILTGYTYVLFDNIFGSDSIVIDAMSIFVPGSTAPDLTWDVSWSDDGDTDGTDLNNTPLNVTATGLTSDDTFDDNVVPPGYMVVAVFTDVTTKPDQSFTCTLFYHRQNAAY
jgi:hypothetical protein